MSTSPPAESRSSSVAHARRRAPRDLRVGSLLLVLVLTAAPVRAQQPTTTLVAPPSTTTTTLLAGGPVLATTPEDFLLPGTQVGDVAAGTITTSSQCAGCHGHYDPQNDPYSTWSGSLMAHSGRDPLFFAQLSTASQDVAGVGSTCMRCHVPMSTVTGHGNETDASMLDASDRDGVTCHFCHSMVDPLYQPGISPVEDEAVLTGLAEVPGYYGNAMFVLDPGGARRGPYDDALPVHEWIESPFHRSSDLCGTCHDGGNLAISRQGDGSYLYNDVDTRAPTDDPHGQFPLDRTYTEWKLSSFAGGGVDMGGRFGGENASVVGSCQDCHMPRVTAKGCSFAAVRPDLARHDFAGGAAPALDLIAEQYKDDPDVDKTAIARARAAAVSMLERAVSLELAQSADSFQVRVVNETGHKLPTGHATGRRVWPNVRFLDDAGTLLEEHGHYDLALAELDELSTVVYEMYVGLSAGASVVTGYPPGPTDHMALADTIEKDNRIPPRGFTNAAFDAAGAPVVGASYADGQHWDDIAFAIPAGTAEAVVTVYYQSTPRHYVEGLRELNYSDDTGETVYQLWLDTGRGAPIEMASETFVIAPPTTTTTLPAVTTTLPSSSTTLPVVTTTLPAVTTTLTPGTTTTTTTSTTLPPVCVVDSDCDDGSFCTSDATCEGGDCVFPSDGYVCCDFVACTVGDVCAGGLCLPGPIQCPTGEHCDAESGYCEPADTRLWIPAAYYPTARFYGAMTASQDFAGGNDADLAADSLMPYVVFPGSAVSAFNGGSGDEVAYTIELPAAGEWYLWGRLYYPGTPGSNQANSFLVRVDDGPALKLGNNKNFFQQWHWDGDGKVETGAPAPLSLGTLEAGTHQIVVEKREVTPTPPRLDVLLLTLDPGPLPSDGDAHAALHGAPVTTTTTTTMGDWPTTTIGDWPTTTLVSVTTTTIPECSAYADCDDGNPCTNDVCIAGQCRHADNALPCDDGLACTAGDSCTDGICAGVASCGVGDACNPSTGACDSTGVWIAAGSEPGSVLSGSMTVGTEFTDGADADANADSLTSPLLFADSTENAFGAASGDMATYTIDLPHAGTWYLWGRLYYDGPPPNGANSFFVRIDGGTALKLGNNKDFFQQWHWDGDGKVESGPVLPLQLGFYGAGVHQLTIEKREATPTPPRLDVIFLTTNPAETPEDGQAVTALGICQDTSQCDDGNPCTDDLCENARCANPDNEAACDDGIGCTLGDVCSGGVCAGTDACAPGQDCDHDTGQCQSPTTTTSSTTTLPAPTTTTTLTTIGQTTTTTTSSTTTLPTPTTTTTLPIDCTQTGECDVDNDGIDLPLDPCPADPRNLCFGPVAIDGASGDPIRINALVSTTAECAGLKIDCNGDAWLPDFGWNQAGKAGKCNLGGGGEGCVIAGLTDVFGCEDEQTEDLFQCEHWDGAAEPELGYSFDVADGTYVVNLLFANTFTGTDGVGDRVFDILVEGQLAYDDFDQVVAAGGSGIAVVRSVLATVADGDGLQVVLGHGIEHPAIKAIEVIAGEPAATTTTLAPATTTSTLDVSTTTTSTTTTMPTACTSDGDCDDTLFCNGTETCPAGVCVTGDEPCPGQLCTEALQACFDGDPLRGGQLWDSWWLATGASEPTGDHPLYPDIGQQSGSATYRCVECHGWDYKGVDGAYRSGSHYTGIVGVFGATRAPGEMFELLRSSVPPGGHGFGDHGLSDHDIADLIAFLADLVVDTDDYIGPDGRFTGDAVAGETHYAVDGTIPCAACHGTDGTTMNLGSPAAPRWVGSVAADDPWALLHKIRLGNPSTFMPIWLAAGGTTQGAADIGTYIQQSFPSQCLDAGHCDDADVCTGVESCQAGLCQPGTALSCSDGSPCTDDACNPTGGCEFPANTDPCDDGIACTSGDVCSAGTCAGTPDCPSGHQCNLATGQCENHDLDNDGLDDASDPCPGDARNLCYGPVALDSTTGSTLRVNCNGSPTADCAGARLDCNGDTWIADFGFSTPSSSGTCNLGGGTCVLAGVDTLFGCDSAETQDLFQCERFANAVNHPPLSYAFDVAAGDYLVNLFFASTFTGTDEVGDRIFDIVLEDVTVHDDLDQVAAAPGSGVALVRSAIVTVIDGTLDVSFNAEVENAALKAIEVLAGPLAATTTTISTSTTTLGTVTTTLPGVTTTLPATTTTSTTTSTSTSTTVAGPTTTLIDVTTTIPASTTTTTLPDPMPAIAFELSDLATIASPTQAAWGPDGRLYVASLTGSITAYTFDDDYGIVDTQVITALQSEQYSQILGIAFDPLDGTDDMSIYVGHAKIFAKGGMCNFQPPFDYIGKVSRITGPDFSVVEPVITNLPTSNHDHAVNGMVFDDAGDLLVLVGGNTNAGVIACPLGGIPESPLSGALLKAELSKPGFNGAIEYVDAVTGLPSTDQVEGHLADYVPGTDVSVFAAGFRNPYDLVYTTEGRIYSTDNGPDTNLGEAATGPDTQDPSPAADDELNHVVEGGYYGHPNRNRGQTDARQNVYYGPTEPELPGVFDQVMAVLPSSTNGIDEYRAQTFAGAMRGNLLVQKWNTRTMRVVPSADGSVAELVEDLPVQLASLDLVTGPGGVLLGIDFSGGKIVIARPVDGSPPATRVYDIFPWRAPVAGGASFVISGTGFGDLGNTTVTIAGATATLTSVSSTRIRGTVPGRLTAPDRLVDVVVTVDGMRTWLPDAFRYLP